MDRADGTSGRSLEMIRTGLKSGLPNEQAYGFWAELKLENGISYGFQAQLKLLEMEYALRLCKLLGRKGWISEP